jgi:hypothetical protein
MTSTTHPDGRFVYPSDWMNAKGPKYIIIRESFACTMNPHSDNDPNGGEHAVGNISTHASFVWEPYNDQYVCITNSESMKKKRFEVISSAMEFSIWFTTIDGTRFVPSNWLFDFLLRFKP